MHDGILDAQRTCTAVSSAAFQLPRRRALLAFLIPLVCSARGSTHGGGAAASPPIADHDVVWMSGPLVILHTEEKPAQTFLKYEG
jgi:hypothetical protein